MNAISSCTATQIKIIRQSTFGSGTALVLFSIGCSDVRDNDCPSLEIGEGKFNGRIEPANIFSVVIEGKKKRHPNRTLLITLRSNWVWITRYEKGESVSSFICLQSRTSLEGGAGHAAGSLNPLGSGHRPRGLPPSQRVQEGTEGGPSA
jgi:hypothetical protein